MPPSAIVLMLASARAKVAVRPALSFSFAASSATIELSHRIVDSIRVVVGDAARASSVPWYRLYGRSPRTGCV